MRLQDIINRAKSLQEAANIDSLAQKVWHDMCENLTEDQCAKIINNYNQLVNFIAGDTDEGGNPIHDKATVKAIADYMFKYSDRYDYPSSHEDEDDDDAARERMIKRNKQIRDEQRLNDYLNDR